MSTKTAIEPEVMDTNMHRYTVALIKPDAFKRRKVGQVISEIELTPLVMGHTQWNLASSLECWQEFYEEHKSKPFYNDLVRFMTSGPVIVMRLDLPSYFTERADPVQIWREKMGPSDPKERPSYTLRGKLAYMWEPQMENLVHGSDSAEAAHREIMVLHKHRMI